MLSLSRARAPAPQCLLVDNDGTFLDVNATWVPAAVSEPGWWPGGASRPSPTGSSPASPRSRGW